MRQAAFTALRRSTQTPALDFASLPTFDITSGTPPDLGIGPSNPSSSPSAQLFVILHNGLKSPNSLSLREPLNNMILTAAKSPPLSPTPPPLRGPTVLSSAGITPDDIGITYIAASFSPRHRHFQPRRHQNLLFRHSRPHQNPTPRVSAVGGFEVQGGRTDQRRGKSLHVAKAGIDTRDPSDVAKADLDELRGGREWRTWLEAVTRAD
ncbi:hypothetical protein FRC04_000036 [Tulasnella sp. 424]|nr:hypothetical protein FRC04_000036 [Tulasnella sp. 424]KAG8981899.1 hypothetical protein FRC05_000041 [Tulasnella sp. 425]